MINEEVSVEELGGADVHAKKSGVSHFTYAYRPAFHTAPTHYHIHGKIFLYFKKAVIIYNTVDYIFYIIRMSGIVRYNIPEFCTLITAALSVMVQRCCMHIPRQLCPRFP